MKIKIFSTLAQLFVNGKYVGSVFFDRRDTLEVADGTIHNFFQKESQVAEILADGGKYGSHFKKER